jgi:hypothetical protein
MKPFDPRRMIIWVSKNRENVGVFVAGVVRSASGLQVAPWVENHDVGHSDDELVKHVAQLKCLDIQACPFPSEIKFETTYDH